jgi:hypothetical protein
MDSLFKKENDNNKAAHFYVSINVQANEENRW